MKHFWGVLDMVKPSLGDHKASKWTPLLTFLVQDSVPSVTRLWPGNCLWLPPPTLEWSPTALVCGLHGGLHACGLLGEPFQDTRRFLIWMWNTGGLGQCRFLNWLTKVGNSFTKQVFVLFFFFKSGKSWRVLLKFRACGLGGEKDFPKGNRKLHKMVKSRNKLGTPGTTHSWEPGRGQRPLQPPRVHACPSHGAPQASGHSLLAHPVEELPFWVTAVSAMRRRLCFSGLRPRGVRWPVQEACRQVHCSGWRLRGGWACWGRGGVVLSGGRGWGLTQGTPGHFPKAARLKCGLHLGTGEKMKAGRA